MQLNMRRLIVGLAGTSLLAMSMGALAQQATPTPPNTYGVTLEGRAVLPALTFAEGPASGAAITAGFGLTVPFEGQPVQGFSSVMAGENGHYFVLSDNGFGAKANSADYNLRWYEVAPDFETGAVEVVAFTEMRDSNNVAGFPIVNEGTEERVLTGADFDPESFRMAPDGTIWVGEEFGPFLLHFSADGVLLDSPITTPYPEVLAGYARGLDYVQSIDNPAFAGLADQAARTAAANHRSSRGFEGMAISVDGTILYPLLEGAMTDDPLQVRLLLQPFDLATMSYTGEHYFYGLSAPGNAIGELIAVNETQFIVIERDNNEGAAAAFKRLYLIDLSTAAPDGVLSKTLIADLMAIEDVNGLTTAEEGALGLGEIFTFPFTTIESVLIVDADTLLVIDDNNFPFANGRRPGLAPDDNEFILISLPEALNVAQ